MNEANHAPTVQPPLSTPPFVSPSRPTTPLHSSPTTAQHPLKSPKFTLTDHGGEGTSSSSYAIANGSTTNGIRSRRVTPAPSPPSGQVDLDVTRPSLKRLTEDTVIPPRANPAYLFSGQKVAKGKERGKGKARSDTISSQSSDIADDDGLLRGEREVLIHKLVKTDTIASISLQYGITPQALRSSNRLWPSDSIHLRSVLHIPLDLCNLPSSSSIDRVSRDEEGDLVIWERENESQSLVSPTARLPEADLLGLNLVNFESDNLLASFDDFRSPPLTGKGKGKEMEKSEHDEDHAVAQYLSSTNNPYSSTSPPPPPSFASPSVVPSSSRPGSGPLERPSSTTSSLGLGFGTSATASESASTSASALATKKQPRTLHVSRIPASQLSFFPPPSPAFSAPSSSRSSFDSQDVRSLGSMNSRSSSSQLFVGSLGPLTNSLAKMALQPLSPSSSSSSSERNPKLNDHHHERSRSMFARTTSHPLNANEGTTKSSRTWAKRWDLLYFGAEEEAMMSDLVELRESERRRSLKRAHKD